MLEKIKGSLFILLTVVVGIFFTSCSTEQLYIVLPNDTRVAFMGRVDRTDSTAVIYWSGSSISINFEGTEIKAILKDEKGCNYFEVIVDNEVQEKIKLDTIKKTYTLAKGLKPGKHHLQLFKATEGADGKTWLYGMLLHHSDSLLSPDAPAKRNIEFYGNSITCGYAVEDMTGDSGDPQYRNNYKSYAAITARHYNAGYHCISKSGIGLMLSWFPIIMPEMYDRVNPEDSIRKWDFSNYKPDIVVINLLQNDSWLVHKHDYPQFRARFGTTPPDDTFIINAYKNFLKTIRSKYPEATIICALGSMDATKEGSPWPGYIENAAAEMHDNKVLTHFFPFQNTKTHPKEKEQQAMAESLISFIDSTIKW
jgi:hypothetical protein